MSWEGWASVSVLNEKVRYRKHATGEWSFKLHPPIEEWLALHVGLRANFTTRDHPGVWHMTYPLTDHDTVFYFKNPDHALLFKLTWGGS